MSLHHIKQLLLHIIYNNSSLPLLVSSKNIGYLWTLKFNGFSKERIKSFFICDHLYLAYLQLVSLSAATIVFDVCLQNLAILLSCIRSVWEILHFTSSAREVWQCLSDKDYHYIFLMPPIKCHGMKSKITFSVTILIVDEYWVFDWTWKKLFQNVWSRWW